MWIRCTNVTDGRTDTGRQQRPSLRIASPGKKCTTTTCQPRLRLGPCCGAYGAPTDPIVGGQGACCPLPQNRNPALGRSGIATSPPIFLAPQVSFLDQYAWTFSTPRIGSACAQMPKTYSASRRERERSLLAAGLSIQLATNEPATITIVQFARVIAYVTVTSPNEYIAAPLADWLFGSL